MTTANTHSDIEVKVVLFASLRETIGISELALHASTLSELMPELRTLLGDDAYLALTAENVRIAVNQTLLEPGHSPKFAPGDEIAFLPPVTGG